MTRDSSTYWNGIAVEWAKPNAFGLWRAYSDAVNAALFLRWTERPAARLLKTDLFDEAVGKGVYAPLAARSDMVFGVDISLLTAVAARDHNAGLRVVVADVRSLPFAEGAFGIVFSNSTLDHFDSREHIASSLRELNRVLRHGGELLLTLDNLANPLVAVRNVLPFEWLYRWGIVPYQIGAALRPRQLEETVARAGFTVRRVGAIMHIPRLPSITLSRILGRYIGAERRERLVHLMVACEWLETLPTHFLTGYFVAIRASKGRLTGLNGQC